MHKSGGSQLRLSWHSVRVVQETVLAVTAHGVPVALPKGTMLFGPIAEAGDFAIMTRDSESYRCHIDDLHRFTGEIRPASADGASPQDKVA